LKQPIFIIGCPRSGTTILGEFFEVSPHCDYFNEIDIWDNETPSNYKSGISQKLLKKTLSYTRRNLKLTILLKGTRLAILDTLKVMGMIKKKDDAINGHRLLESDVTKEIEKIAKSYLSEKHLVVKSTPASLRIPFLKKIFPDAKFVHVLRDGRDVACSLMNAPSGYFWSYIKPPGWKEIRKKYKGIRRCAWQWKATLDIINSDKKNISQEDFIEIQYEDFVNNPDKTVKIVFEKLKIPFEKEQEKICKKVKNKITISDLSKNDRSTVLDHSFRIGRYKTELTKEQLDQVEKIIGYK